MPGVIALMGSGETAPGMTKHHRALFERAPEGPQLLLDTSYAFQVNREQMTEKLLEYFDVSLHQQLTPVVFPRTTTAGPVEKELVRRQIAGASYLFAGPGSPSYALRHWRDLDVVPALRQLLDRGGVLTLASAATLTIGRATAPIYEIYKAGEEPRWLPGLDLLGQYGLDLAVIPHFDNAEGGSYDTRYCYLGEDRLTYLEEQLEPSTTILGVDEHTVAFLDLGEMTLRAEGREAITLRRHGTTVHVPAGTTRSLDDLVTTAATPAQLERASATDERDPLAVAEELARAGGASADLLAQLLALAASHRSPDLTDHVETLVALRQRARDNRQFAISDGLRDALLALGVEIADAPGASTWNFTARR